MVQVLVERIDEDPVQDPLLAWHRAIAPRTVASMAWEPPNRLKDNRLAPGAARVTWREGTDTFIACRRPGTVHGISDAVVIGLVTPRVRDWRPGWQPVETVPRMKIVQYKKGGAISLPESAAIAVIPDRELLATFWGEAVWWELDHAANWLETLSRDRATTQRLDPIEFPQLITALVEVLA